MIVWTYSFKTRLNSFFVFILFCFFKIKFEIFIYEIVMLSNWALQNAMRFFKNDKIFKKISSLAIMYRIISTPINSILNLRWVYCNPAIISFNHLICFRVYPRHIIDFIKPGDLTRNNWSLLINLQYLKPGNGVLSISWR